MEAMVLKAEALPDYKLKLELTDGDIVIINFSKRIETMRFHLLSDLKMFSNVKADGDKIVWISPQKTFSVFVNELLE